MRLLDTTKLTFKEFFESEIPDYAILSHRWTGEEVSFQEYQLVLDQQRFGDKLPIYLSEKADDVKFRSGYQKILGFCDIARQANYKWAWIDTCCIDKSSSAELSEAINSMWQWYRHAATCYVYLYDVTSIENAVESDWFTRGWTLQELLAPRNLRFFSQDWKQIYILDKTTFESEGRYRAGFADEDVRDDIKSKMNSFAHVRQATGIPLIYITGYSSLDRASVAQKLSWASSRQTTREEDRAYSLLGLLGVNMPLLYGEHKQAFIRLQRKFIRKYDDDSIFAWRVPCQNPRLRLHCESGILAENVECFKDSQDVVSIPQRGRRPWQIINQLLEVEAVHYAERVSGRNSVVLTLPLSCRHGRNHKPVHLRLQASQLAGDYKIPFMRVFACDFDGRTMDPESSRTDRFLIHLMKKR